MLLKPIHICYFYLEKKMCISNENENGIEELMWYVI